MTHLEQYFRRIGYAGSSEPTLNTLTAIHRAHLRSIPYENLDIHLGRRLTLEPDHIFQKLVLEGRGGWCYEMNSLLAWALGGLGFKVEYLAGAVPRASAGPNAEGNHLVLLVHLSGGDWIADVGFGDGFLEPIPFAEGSYSQYGFEFRLERGPEPGRWTVHSHPHSAAPTYDFGLETYQLGHFQSRCNWLQTSPDSGFVRTTVCQRFVGESILTLRGATLSTVTPDGKQQQTIETEAEYAQVLRDGFGLGVDASLLWPKVWQRHLEWLATEAEG
jgi:N-hydroxyarylamine O-acetyltransferase